MSLSKALKNIFKWETEAIKNYKLLIKKIKKIPESEMIEDPTGIIMFNFGLINPQHKGLSLILGDKKSNPDPDSVAFFSDAKSNEMGKNVIFLFSLRKNGNFGSFIDSLEERVSFVHEFVHYLDYKYSGGKKMRPAPTQEKHGGMKFDDKYFYYNYEPEFKSHFAEIIILLNEMFETNDEVRELILDNDVQTFLKRLLTNEYTENFFNWLTSKHKKVFMQMVTLWFRKKRAQYESNFVLKNLIKIEEAMEDDFIKYLKKQGKHKEGDKIKVDPKEIKMGVNIEKEHSDNEEIARQIVMDHLQEIPNYYTLLIRMEKVAKEKLKSPYKEIAQFFKKNPSPSDKKVHKFAGKMGVNEHKFEEKIYRLLTYLLGE